MLESDARAAPGGLALWPGPPLLQGPDLHPGSSHGQTCWVLPAPTPFARGNQGARESGRPTLRGPTAHIGPGVAAVVVEMHGNFYYPARCPDQIGYLFVSTLSKFMTSLDL